MSSLIANKVTASPDWGKPFPSKEGEPPKDLTPAVILPPRPGGPGRIEHKGEKR